MRTYRYILLSVLLACSLQTSFAGGRERVYLQTDKQTYLSGELLWMKLYLTDEQGRPSSLSKVGYVELLNESTAQVQVKLDIAGGTGEGWMELPATLPSGYYRLTAYTRFMRNEGEAVYFSKTIAVVNTFTVDPAIPADTAIAVAPPSVLENNLSVTTGRAVLPVRTQDEIHLQGLPENVHSLSVSIAGKDLAPVRGTSTIAQWKKQLSTLPAGAPSSEFLPEYEGHIISGRIVNVKTGESNAEEHISPLLGFVGDQIRLFGGQVQANKSDVLFFTHRIQGMHELATATYSFTSNQYRVDILSPFATHGDFRLQDFRLNPNWADVLQQRSLGLQVLHTFTADSLNRIDTTYAHFRHKPYKTYLLDEYTRFTTMEEVVIEYIPTLRFRRINNVRSLAVLNEERTAFSIGNSLVMLDGVPLTDHETIFRYDPLLVRQLDVYRGKYNFGGQFFDGMIFFTTYNVNYNSLKVGDNTQFFDYDGTQGHRRFYAPSYRDESEKKSRIPDYRHTLLWLPEADTKGAASIDIPFSTSDLTGEFQVTVEGLTEDGQIIRGNSSFKVE